MLKLSHIPETNEREIYTYLDLETLTNLQKTHALSVGSNDVLRNVRTLRMYESLRPLEIKFRPYRKLNLSHQILELMFANKLPEMSHKFNLMVRRFLLSSTNGNVWRLEKKLTTAKNMLIAKHLFRLAELFDTTTLHYKEKWHKYMTQIIKFQNNQITIVEMAVACEEARIWHTSTTLCRGIYYPWWNNPRRGTAHMPPWSVSSDSRRSVYVYNTCWGRDTEEQVGVQNLRQPPHPRPHPRASLPKSTGMMPRK